MLTPSTAHPHAPSSLTPNEAPGQPLQTPHSPANSTPLAKLPARNFKGYEEVKVPPAQALPPPTADELVPISGLPAWARPAFPGYKALNRIQSRIYPAAFGRWAGGACVCLCVLGHV